MFNHGSLSINPSIMFSKVSVIVIRMHAVPCDIISLPANVDRVDAHLCVCLCSYCCLIVCAFIIFAMF